MKRSSHGHPKITPVKYVNKTVKTVNAIHTRKRGSSARLSLARLSGNKIMGVAELLDRTHDVEKGNTSVNHTHCSAEVKYHSQCLLQRRSVVSLAGTPGIAGNS